MDSRRVKTAPGQNVMHQGAVDTAVAIREWVDIHESEGKHGCGNYRVHLLFGAAVERNHALIKGWQILGPRADVVGNGRTAVTVMLANEAAFLPQAKPDKALIADYDALQAQQFVKIKRCASRLADRPAPALYAVLRRAPPLTHRTPPLVFYTQEPPPSRANIAPHADVVPARPLRPV